MSDFRLVLCVDGAAAYCMYINQTLLNENTVFTLCPIFLAGA